MPNCQIANTAGLAIWHYGDIVDIVDIVDIGIYMPNLQKNQNKSVILN